jgi:hypothetical protein
VTRLMIPGTYSTEKEVFQCNHFIWAAMLAKGMLIL